MDFPPSFEECLSVSDVIIILPPLGPPPWLELAKEALSDLVGSVLHTAPSDVYLDKLGKLVPLADSDELRNSKQWKPSVPLCKLLSHRPTLFQGETVHLGVLIVPSKTRFSFDIPEEPQTLDPDGVLLGLSSLPGSRTETLSSCLSGGDRQWLAVVAKHLDLNVDIVVRSEAEADTLSADEETSVATPESESVQAKHTTQSALRHDFWSVQCLPFPKTRPTPQHVWLIPEVSGLLYEVDVVLTVPVHQLNEPLNIVLGLVDRHDASQHVGTVDKAVTLTQYASTMLHLERWLLSDDGDVRSAAPSSEGTKLMQELGIPWNPGGSFSQALTRALVGAMTGKTVMTSHKRHDTTKPTPFPTSSAVPVKPVIERTRTCGPITVTRPLKLTACPLQTETALALEICNVNETVPIEIESCALVTAPSVIEGSLPVILYPGDKYCLIMKLEHNVSTQAGRQNSTQLLSGREGRTGKVQCHPTFVLTPLEIRMKTVLPLTLRWKIASSLVASVGATTEKVDDHVIPKSSFWYQYMTEWPCELQAPLEVSVEEAWNDGVVNNYLKCLRVRVIIRNNTKQDIEVTVRFGDWKDLLRIKTRPGSDVVNDAYFETTLGEQVLLPLELVKPVGFVARVACVDGLFRLIGAQKSAHVDLRFAVGDDDPKQLPPLILEDDRTHETLLVVAAKGHLPTTNAVT